MRNVIRQEGRVKIIAKLLNLTAKHMKSVHFINKEIGMEMPSPSSTMEKKAPPINGFQQEKE